MFDGAAYIVRAMLISEGVTTTRDLGTMAKDETYEFEAKVDWNDQMVFFKFGRPSTGTLQQGVIPFPARTIEDRTLTPMFVLGQLDGDGGTPATVEFYLWKSQGKKEALGP